MGYESWRVRFRSGVDLVAVEVAKVVGGLGTTEMAIQLQPMYRAHRSRAARLARSRLTDSSVAYWPEGTYGNISAG